ncbi:alpha/beta fold hydrolase [Lentzea kristufekii]|uniref:alpha/beta fold hydrolase n=1 Tax=Lentzea kristufekii TaxID=3095430 RepID=UPI00387393FE
MAVRSLEAGWEHTSGPVVAVVPGLGALGYLKDTVDACAVWARTFLLDVPGFGRRGPQGCPPEVPAIAETVSAWLAQVAGGPVVLAGHSAGAQAALHVAAAHPDRVSALVLLGPTFPPEQHVLSGLVRLHPQLPPRATRSVPGDRALLPARRPEGTRAVRPLRAARRTRARHHRCPVPGVPRPRRTRRLRAPAVARPARGGSTPRAVHDRAGRRSPTLCGLRHPRAGVPRWRSRRPPDPRDSRVRCERPGRRARRRW